MILGRSDWLGKVGEWFMPAVLKTAEPKGSVSSNLTLSATMWGYANWKSEPT